MSYLFKSHKRKFLCPFSHLLVPLFFFLLLSPVCSPAQEPGKNDYKIEDLVGRWERWPEKRDGNGIWLYTYFTKSPNEMVSADIKLSDFEQKEYGPMKPGRGPVFTGKFNPEGFDISVECSTKELCFPLKYVSTSPTKTTPDVIPGSLRKAADISVPYRYHLRFLRSDLLLVTAYTPRYTIGDKVFSGAVPEAIVRQFYLTRNDTCEKSKEIIEKEIINGEFSDRLVYVFGQPRKLPAGTAILNDDLMKTEMIKFRKPGCFYFVDLMPSAMYFHPVLYLVVDEESGKITSREWASSPPLVSDPRINNGEPTYWYENQEDRIGSPDLIFPVVGSPSGRTIVRPGYDLKLPLVKAPIEASLGPIEGLSSSLAYTFQNAAFRSGSRSQHSNCSTSRKVAVLINAGKDEAFDYSTKKINALLTQLRFDVVKELSWQIHSLNDIREQISDLSSKLGPCDTFVVYLTAHVLGAKVGRVQGPGYRTDGEVTYKHPSKILGIETSFHPWSISNRKSNSTWYADDYDTGPGLLYTLRNANAGFIQVIVDMCMSGLIIESAKGASPDWGGPPIAEFLRKDQTLMLITATARDQESNINSDARTDLLWGNLGRGDAWDLGGLFTQLFVKEYHNAMKDGAVDRNRDGVVSTDEYKTGSRIVFNETKDQFHGPLDRWLRSREQDPQFFEVTGTKEP